MVIARYNEVMKINETGRTSQTGKAKKSDKTKTQGDGTFGELIGDGAQETQSAGASQAMARVDSLLDVQASEDPAERAARQRMQQRAHSILDELENIRVSLLTGTLTVGQMLNVADIVASHREKISDPRLVEIMDEIDLRAQVEIAKMRKSLDDQEKQAP